MSKLTTLGSETELAKLIGECTVNNIRFQNGPTSYSVQDCFSGVLHVSTMKKMANAVNDQLKKLETDDLFADGSASQRYNKTVLTLKKDALVAIVKFIEAALKAEVEAEKKRKVNTERVAQLKQHIASKEFEAMGAKDADVLKRELEELEASM